MKIPILAIALSLLVFSPGCKHATTTPPTGSTDTSAATNVSNIASITANSINIGLTVYANSNPDEAKNVAYQIETIADNTLLPYLNNNVGASSAVINELLKQNFVNLPTIYQSAISVAAGLLDSYLPAPSPTTYLSAAQLLYVKAFVQGLSDGSSQFLGGVRAKSVTKRSPGNWLNFKKPSTNE